MVWRLMQKEGRKGKGMSLFVKPVKKEIKTIAINDEFQFDKLWGEMTRQVIFESTIRMFLENNKCQYILMEICHIPLNSLLILNLNNNWLNSIFPIINLLAPCLEKLDLSHNYINCVRPLGNSAFQSLKELRIEMNPIIDYCPLTKMPGQALNFILMNFNQKMEWCCFGTSFIAKLKTKHPRRIMCGSSGSLTANKTKQMMARKYQSLLLYDTLWM